MVDDPFAGVQAPRPPADPIKRARGLAYTALVSAAENDGRDFIPAQQYRWRDPASIPPRRFLYGRQIQRGHIRGIIAPGGVGKTSYTIGEALSMASGKPLLGVHVPHPSRVWLWNLEDPREELERQVQAACLHWGLTPEDIGDRLMLNCGLDGDKLRIAFAGEKGLEVDRPLAGWILGELSERDIDYLGIDPFVSSHGADESSNMDVDAIAKTWATIADLSGAAIGIVHHTSKAGAVEVTTHSSRGAVALTDACRSVLTLNRMGEDEAKRYGIEGLRRRRYFRVYDDKNNRAPAADSSDWFEFVSVDLGNAMDGIESDSVGVVQRWVPPDAFEGVTVDHLYRVQMMIAEGRWRENVQATDWAGHAVAAVLNLDGNDKAHRARITQLLRQWKENGALTVVTGKVDGKDKPFIEVGRWANDDIPPP